MATPIWQVVVTNNETTVLCLVFFKRGNSDKGLMMSPKHFRLYPIAAAKTYNPQSIRLTTMARSIKQEHNDNNH